MKTLLINDCDKEGGAARAAFRLHQGFRSQQIASSMLVGRKISGDENVFHAHKRWPLGVSLLRQALDKLPLWRYKNSIQEPFSPAIIPDHLSSQISCLAPDIIHLHWVLNGFLRLESLKHFNRPIVWTLHDMWAFTGGCHYDEFCGRYKDCCGMCPQLESRRQHDLSCRIWKRKKEAWKDLDITVVTPSRWLAACAKESSLFRDRKVEVIPNGLNTETYKPVDKRVAREIWGLPLDKRILLFGAIKPSSNRRKGFHLLESALKSLARLPLYKDVELVIFGSDEYNNSPQFGLKTYYKGQLNDDVSLALLYAAADLFVLPSLQDNLPNTILEAFACGTPAVAFNVGGVPDIIDHRENGYLVNVGDTQDLTHGIKWVLEDSNRLLTLGRAARDKAVSEYPIELQVKRYLELYGKIIEQQLGG